jgi:hypothetical protein
MNERLSGRPKASKAAGETPYVTYPTWRMLKGFGALVFPEVAFAMGTCCHAQERRDE